MRSARPPGAPVELTSCAGERLQPAAIADDRPDERQRDRHVEAEPAIPADLFGRLALRHQRARHRDAEEPPALRPATRRVHSSPSGCRMNEKGPKRSRSTPGPSPGFRDRCETKLFSPKRRVHFSPRPVCLLGDADGNRGGCGGKAEQAGDKSGQTPGAPLDGAFAGEAVEVMDVGEPPPRLGQRGKFLGHHAFQQRRRRRFAAPEADAKRGKACLDLVERQQPDRRARAWRVMASPPISRSASSRAGVGGTCGPSPASAISVQRRSTACPCRSRPIGIDDHAAAVGTEMSRAGRRSI